MNQYLAQADLLISMYPHPPEAHSRAWIADVLSDWDILDISKLTELIKEANVCDCRIPALHRPYGSAKNVRKCRKNEVVESMLFELDTMDPSDGFKWISFLLCVEIIKRHELHEVRCFIEDSIF